MDNRQFDDMARKFMSGSISRHVLSVGFGKGNAEKRLLELHLFDTIDGIFKR
jgi:hypothetical protein